METRRQGKEKLVVATEAGVAFCDAYREVRERLLADAVAAEGPGDAALSDAADLLRRISGQYNQAARAAATL